ncbi:MAG: PAS domain S-box protein [Bacteroidales bacterium]|nr:PAS domain S-box protein [Bacteroidales bacterium]
MKNQDKSKEELIKELLELKQAHDALKVSFNKHINQQKLVEAALLENERKYRLLAQNSSDVIWTLDNDYRFTYISPSIYQLRGLTPEEAMLETIQDTMTPDSQEAVYQSIVNGQENERAKNYVPVQLEIEQYHKDGHLIWVEISLRAMLNDLGEKIGYVGISRDITLRKMAEEALRQSEEKFRSLADTAKVVIDIVADDMGAKHLYVNEEWSRVHGYSKEEAQYIKPIDLVAPDSRQQVLDNAAKRIRGEKAPINYEIKSITKLGEIKYLEFSSTIVKFDNQRAFLTTAIDITKRKHAEEALRKSETKLRELNAQKDKFFSIIAHDLRSPFSAIIGLSDLLTDQIKDKDYAGIDLYAKMIGQSSQKALDLLMNLLEWTRAHTGRMVFNPEKFILTDLIEDNKLLFDLIAGQKDIIIKNVLPKEITVFADKSMISTVLRNLISNAIKFSGKGGEINISVEKNANEILVSISDNGVGIAPKRLDKLFRIDESDSTPGTNNEKGTGLGLILCKEFVEKHGGKIWVESEEGKGSTFYFTL